MPTVRGWGWGVLCAICVMASACTRESRPNVVLIVIDTLRADRLGAYGNQHGLTPFLDELAGRGTVFLNAYSTASYTNSSVASLFSSRYPSQLHLAHYEAKIADAEVMLAEELHQRGYAAAGFMANPLVTASLGFAQGFDHWWVRPGPLKVRAYQLNKLLTEWLDRSWSSSPARPVFLYLQYLEPHAPYLPSESNRRRFERGVRRTTGVTVTWRDLSLDKDLDADELELYESLYDAEVAGLDAELRAVFADLERRSVLQNAVVIVTADHGEAFKEHHDQLGHGRALYEELVHVPLIIIAPGYAPGVVGQNVSLVDVAPTLLELVGAEPPPSFEGRSLVPLLSASSSSWRARIRAGWHRTRAALGGSAAEPTSLHDRVIIAELERLGGAFDIRRHATAAIRGSKKILVAPTGVEEFYDLGRDPDERNPQDGMPDAEANALRSQLHRTQAELQTRASPEPQRALLDDNIKDTLRALGYDP